MNDFDLLIIVPIEKLPEIWLNTNNSPLKDSSQLSESDKALSVSDETLEQSSVSAK